MTVSNKQCVDVNDLIESMKITVICPICKESKRLKFPKSICESTDNLTTISIPKGLICNHTFQAFVDKNYNIRGYQKVDYQFESNSQKNIEKIPKNLRKVKLDTELFDNLIAEGNFLEYNSSNINLRPAKRASMEPLFYEKDNKRSQGTTFSGREHKTSKVQRERTSVNHEPKSPKKLDIPAKEKKLEEIYEDFWEYIPNDNKTFLQFITTDKRRIHFAS